MSSTLSKKRSKSRHENDQSKYKSNSNTNLKSVNNTSDSIKIIQSSKSPTKSRSLLFNKMSSSKSKYD